VLNITKELKGSTLLVKLAGSIEESVNFEQQIGPVPAEIIVNCREIPRINSVGVKAWIKYFQSLSAKNIKIHYTDCSTAIIEQMNLISNFGCGGSVDSMFVPFSCTSCSKELIGCFKTVDIKAMQNNIPSQKCTKCGGQAIFDDIPEEYFGFLNR